MLLTTVDVRRLRARGWRKRSWSEIVQSKQSEKNEDVREKKRQAVPRRLRLLPSIDQIPASAVLGTPYYLSKKEVPVDTRTGAMRRPSGSLGDFRTDLQPLVSSYNSRWMLQGGAPDSYSVCLVLQPSRRQLCSRSTRLGSARCSRVPR